MSFSVTPNIRGLGTGHNVAGGEPSASQGSVPIDPSQLKKGSLESFLKFQTEGSAELTRSIEAQQAEKKLESQRETIFRTLKPAESDTSINAEYTKEGPVLIQTTVVSPRQTNLENQADQDVVAAKYAAFENPVTGDLATLGFTAEIPKPPINERSAEFTVPVAITIDGLYHTGEAVKQTVKHDLEIDLKIMAVWKFDTSDLGSLTEKQYKEVVNSAIAAEVLEKVDISSEVVKPLVDAFVEKSAKLADKPLCWAKPNEDESTTYVFRHPETGEETEFASKAELSDWLAEQAETDHQYAQFKDAIFSQRNSSNSNPKAIVTKTDNGELKFEDPVSGDVTIFQNEKVMREWFAANRPELLDFYGDPNALELSDYIQVNKDADGKVTYSFRDPDFQPEGSLASRLWQHMSSYNYQKFDTLKELAGHIKQKYPQFLKLLLLGNDLNDRWLRKVTVDIDVSGDEPKLMFKFKNVTNLFESPAELKAHVAKAQPELYRKLQAGEPFKWSGFLEIGTDPETESAYTWNDPIDGPQDLDSLEEVKLFLRASWPAEAETIIASIENETDIISLPNTTHTANRDGVVFYFKDGVAFEDFTTRESNDPAEYTDDVEFESRLVEKLSDLSEFLELAPAELAKVIVQTFEGTEIRSLDVEIGYGKEKFSELLKEAKIEAPKDLKKLRKAFELARQEVDRPTVWQTAFAITTAGLIAGQGLISFNEMLQDAPGKASFGENVAETFRQIGEDLQGAANTASDVIQGRGGNAVAVGLLTSPFGWTASALAGLTTYVVSSANAQPSPLFNGTQPALNCNGTSTTEFNLLCNLAAQSFDGLNPVIQELLMNNIYTSGSGYINGSYAVNPQQWFGENGFYPPVNASDLAASRLQVQSLMSQVVRLNGSCPDASRSEQPTNYSDQACNRGVGPIPSSSTSGGSQPTTSGQPSQTTGAPPSSTSSQPPNPTSSAQPSEGSSSIVPAGINPIYIIVPVGVVVGFVICGVVVCILIRRNRSDDRTDTIESGSREEGLEELVDRRRDEEGWEDAYTVPDGVKLEREETVLKAAYIAGMSQEELFGTKSSQGNPGTNLSRADILDFLAQRPSSPNAGYGQEVSKTIKFDDDFWTDGYLNPIIVDLFNVFSDTKMADAVVQVLWIPDSPKYNPFKKFIEQVIRGEAQIGLNVNGIGMEERPHEDFDRNLNKLFRGNTITTRLLSSMVNQYFIGQLGRLNHRVQQFVDRAIASKYVFSAPDWKNLATVQLGQFAGNPSASVRGDSGPLWKLITSDSRDAFIADLNVFIDTLQEDLRYFPGDLKDIAKMYAIAIEGTLGFAFEKLGQRDKSGIASVREGVAEYAPVDGLDFSQVDDDKEEAESDEEKVHYAELSAFDPDYGDQVPERMEKPSLESNDREEESTVKQLRYDLKLPKGTRTVSTEEVVRQTVLAFVILRVINPVIDAYKVPLARSERGTDQRKLTLLHLASVILQSIANAPRDKKANLGNAFYHHLKQDRERDNLIAKITHMGMGMIGSSKDEQ